MLGSVEADDVRGHRPPTLATTIGADPPPPSDRPTVNSGVHRIRIGLGRSARLSTPLHLGGWHESAHRSIGRVRCAWRPCSRRRCVVAAVAAGDAEPSARCSRQRAARRQRRHSRRRLKPTRESSAPRRRPASHRRPLGPVHVDGGHRRRRRHGNATRRVAGGRLAAGRRRRSASTVRSRPVPRSGSPDARGTSPWPPASARSPSPPAPRRSAATAASTSVSAQCPRRRPRSAHATRPSGSTPAPAPASHVGSVAAADGGTGHRRQRPDFVADGPGPDSVGAVDPASAFSTSAGRPPSGHVPGDARRRVGPAGAAPTSSATDADSAIASIAITRRPSPASPSTGTGAGTARLDVAGDDRRRHVRRDDHVHHRRRPRPGDDAARSRVTVEAPPVLTPISAVQGPAPASPIVGQDVVVEAVVTSMFTRQDVPDGFFVQEEDGDGDTTGHVRGHVRVLPRRLPGRSPPVTSSGSRGEVAEFFGMTQVDGDRRHQRADRRRCRAATPLPTATAVDAPGRRLDARRGDVRDRRGDGRHVPRHARRHRVLRARPLRPARADRRRAAVPVHPRQRARAPPATPRSSPTWRPGGSSSTTTTTTRTTPSATAPDEPYPYPTPGLSVDQPACAAATRSTGLTGVLHWSFAGQTGTDAWRVRPIPGEDYTFEPANPPPGRAGRRRRRPAGSPASTSSTTSRRSTRRRRTTRAVRAVGHARLPWRRLGRRAGAPAGQDRRRHRRRSTPTSSG